LPVHRKCLHKFVPGYYGGAHYGGGLGLIVLLLVLFLLFGGLGHHYPY